MKVGIVEFIFQLQNGIIQIPSYFWFIIIPLAIIDFLLGILLYYFADKSFYYVREKFPKKLPSYIYIEIAESKRKNPFTYVWAFIFGKYVFDDTLKKWTRYGRLIFIINIILSIIIIVTLIILFSKFS